MIHQDAMSVNVRRVLFRATGTDPITKNKGAYIFKKNDFSTPIGE